MSEADDSVADVVATAIADREDIDWDELTRQGADTAVDPGLLHQLRIIEAIATTGRGRAAPRGAPRFGIGGLAFAALLLVAGGKVAFGIVGALWFSQWPEVSAMRAPPILSALLFGAAGAVLVLGGARDERGRALGALFVLIAATFAAPLVPASELRMLGPALSILRDLPVDAFLAFALWRFVYVFPTADGPPLERRIGRAGVAFSGLVGVVLFAMEGLRASGVFAASASIVTTTLALVDRTRPALAYWPLLFATAAGAVPYLVWRGQAQPVEERRRVAVFGAALVIGLTPFLVAVTASPFVPSLAEPQVRRWVGIGLYVALWSIVPMTAHAVIVRRVFDVRLAIHRASQHRAARLLVWGVGLVPLLDLAVTFYAHRASTVGGLFERGSFLALVALSGVGFAILTFRDRLLLAVDRWFLREQVDVGDVLARLTRGFRYARSTSELAGTMAHEIERALHPASVVIALIADETSSFVPVAGRGEPLGVRSELAALLRSGRAVLQFDDDGDGSLTGALPIEEQQWLAQGGVRLLAPLSASSGHLVGYMAIGASRSGLSWARRERVVIATLSGHFEARLENLLVRREAAGQQSPGFAAPSVDWDREPAASCLTCSTIWPAGVATCSCGGATATAALPFILDGKFRLQQVIGAGPTCVVYRAIDLTLGRLVAIKTLASPARESDRRIRTEARAMAAVQHPSLAAIYGVEVWRGAPMLVVEYLANGTLADRLRRGPIEPNEVISLGIFLADALDRVHGSAFLHRDIKPSNIGFTEDDLPKLLDFGFASLYEHVAESERGPGEVRWAETAICGTPLYLSPEAAAGATPQPSFDLWALSMTLLEAINGRHPFAARSLDEVMEMLRTYQGPASALRGDCPELLREFFDRALSPVPARRPTTAAEMRNQLQRLRTPSTPLD